MSVDCLTAGQIERFISLLEIEITRLANAIVIHATEGDVYWTLTKGLYCTGTGLAA